MTRLAGKCAVITGGGTGIGQAIALAFAREGAQVAVAGRRKNKLDETLRLLQQAGCSALALEGDVTKAADTERIVKSAEDAFGKMDILVNNAGALSVSTIESIAEEDWDRVMATNVKGPFLMSRASLPAMRRAGGGSIINVGSVLGIVAIRDRAAYCASKGGVTMLTKAMALDHAHDNIRVNCVCPSIVESDMTRNLFAETEVGREARESRLASIPLGRFGKPTDIAGLAVFLASEESSWMTGTVIPVDGGVTAY
ncbi:MAG TPA: SDR family NAD(P)-dependent oxidoreductase [Candidatus Acidoferrales bacterium]|nr:SDR family NAD(P)-dependent oxidoreductase [Candidatus Acidoferrales bacterium]